jgi:hypothetical protein
MRGDEYADLKLIAENAPLFFHENWHCEEIDSRIWTFRGITRALLIVHEQLRIAYFLVRGHADRDCDNVFHTYTLRPMSLFLIKSLQKKYLRVQTY